MVTFNGKISLDIVFNELISNGNQTSGINPSKFSFLVDLLTGTLDNQINVAFAETKTAIGSAVTTVYDLVGGLTDIEGTVINIDEVVLIAIRNRSATLANFLSVGPDATAGFGVVAASLGFWADASDRNIVGADSDSWMVLHSKTGVPAAAGASDELAVITQGGTSANTWDIMILGRDN